MPRDGKKADKSGRRGNNEGSIYQRKDGRWCAQATVGYNKDGKIALKYVYGKTRQEVAKKLNRITNDVFENGYIINTSNKDELFCSLLDDWYVTFKEPTISSVTSEKLRNFIKNHINPQLGNLTLQQIDMTVMQRFFNGLSKKGMCLDSIKSIKQLLNQFYTKYAIKTGLCKENPLDDLVIRKRKTHADDDENKSEALTPEQRTLVLTLAKDNPVLYPILTFLLLTGLRPGELIALKWKDIDWESKSISVKKAASREITFDDVGNVKERRQIISNTKTVLSVRSFVVADAVIESLTEWKDYQREQGDKKGLDLTSPSQYVFCTREGTVRTYSGLRSLLCRFLDKYNLSESGINLYSFRHTFATILLEERENPKIVSQLMGHAKVETTLSVYSHITSKSVYKQSAQTLDNAFSKI